MKKFEGILLCTDLDGTLLRNDKTISNENIKAIEYFKSEGGFFTFITGRMPSFVRDIYCEVKPNLPFGCVNGGGIYDPSEQEYVWKREIQSSVTELVEFIDVNVPEVGIQINTFDKVYFCKDNFAMKEFRRITGLPCIKCHYKEISEPMAKVLFADAKAESLEKVKNLLDTHSRADEFDFIRSEQSLYEILPKGISKGTIIEKLVELYGLDIEKTVAIGDYNNDIMMLKTAKVGVAVSNAVEEAKAVADYITVSNEEHAIARVISVIESGEIRL